MRLHAKGLRGTEGRANPLIQYVGLWVAQRLRGRWYRGRGEVECWHVAYPIMHYYAQRGAGVCFHRDEILKCGEISHHSPTHENDLAGGVCVSAYKSLCVRVCVWWGGKVGVGE